MSFIKVMKNKYYVRESIGNLVWYGLDIEDDEMDNYVPEEKWVGFGVNTISPSAVVESFDFVKRRFNKTGGNQLHHFIISLYQNKDYGSAHREKICQYLIYDVGNYLYHLGFNCAGFIHNNYGNVHIHFVVNSVNFRTGKRLHDTKTFYRNLSLFINKTWKNINLEQVIYES